MGTGREAAGAPVPAPGHGHAHPPAAARRPCLDRIKVGMVAVIIAGHAVMQYSSLSGAWPYQPLREVALGPGADTVVLALSLAGSLCTMGLFLFVSGLLTPAAVDRRGPAGFARQRLLRLGLPLVVWVLALWPLLRFRMERVAGNPHSYWWIFWHSEPVPDTGPMWYVEVLLIYSLGYALWRSRRPPQAGRLRGPAGGALVVLGVGVVVGSFLVRLVFPYLSLQVAHLNLWQWPQYLALFGLGVLGGRSSWLDAIPARLRRGCGVAALLGVAGLLAVLALPSALDLDVERFGGGWGWPAVVLATVEAAMAIGVSVWLVGAAQRHLDRPPGPLGRALARGAYGAFLLQGPVIVALTLALRPMPVPAEVKAAAVAVGAVAGSFALAWLVVTRTPLRGVL